MTGLMTLWTAPRAGTPFYREETMLMALSWAINRRTFPHLTLVGDAEAIRWCAARGFTFDEIHPWLDGLESRWSRVWSYGKMEAYRRMGQSRRSFCSIDWDAMLRKPLPERVQQAGIFAQSEESREGRNLHLDHAYQVPHCLKLPYLPGAFRMAARADNRRTLNAGILGGRDLPFFEEAYGESLEVLTHPSNASVWDQLNAQKGDGTQANGTQILLLLEQWWPMQKLLAEGKTLEALLPDNETEEQAAAVGFTHLLGNSKHDRGIQWRVEKTLQRDFPALHRRIARLPPAPDARVSGFVR